MQLLQLLRQARLENCRNCLLSTIRKINFKAGDQDMSEHGIAYAEGYLRKLISHTRRRINSSTRT